ncbi:MAG: radical SAM protein, partial [Anaerolineaceae bacterium]
GDRFLIHNPPYPFPTTQMMDEFNTVKYTRDQHPFYAQQGDVIALETIRLSVSTHRGCYGECYFCSIAVHEGRTVRWRSERSIISEIEQLTKHPEFKGYIQDMGGPTANMYGIECQKKILKGCCEDKRCLYPEACPVLKIDHSKQIALLRAVRKIKGIKKVFIASGIRYDMVLDDKKSGQEYLEEIVQHHVSGQLKVAPEHTDPKILNKMGKTGTAALLEFKRKFDEASEKAGKKQFLTYYFIAAYPGCSDREMQLLRQFTSQKLHIHPEQVQVFTPLPSTYASVMYYTEHDPFTGESLFVEKNLSRKSRQKQIVTTK